MSVFVVDASVAAKWFTEEEHAEAALALLAGQHQLHSPDYFLLELDSIFCKWIRKGLVSEPDAAEARAVLGRLPITWYSFRLLQDGAYAMANLTGRSPCDCLYVALAILVKGRMVTADRRLYDGLRDGPFGGRVVWIEEATEPHAPA